jgi:hypothetical protein
MRIRTPLASVWVDQSVAALPSSTASAAPVAAPAIAVRKPAQVRWADRAYAGKLGRYVAVRLRGEVMDVAIAQPGSAPHWVPASSALTSAEAREWLVKGFNA